ncbi:Caulimovirus viroplasmin [Musa troglodytarum]|uniref:Caulimovirus viroplasmin n=1 Tax=Musa troglodytarum TaxID=320322 RepID=A0A9E7KUU7_9LILI|nr:Caulimovirus viroplasmin [Musa troglodytarum]
MNLIVRKSLINCIPYIFSAALFPQNSHCIMWSSLSGFSSASWRGFSRGSSKVCELDFVLTGFHFHCFSTHHLRTRPLPKKDSQPSMAEESNAFYVVRKGDIIGIYKSLSDCQAQVCLSVCDPPVSVFKGYGLRKETEEYLASRGLKNPLYSVNASDVKADLFGPLLPCPFQQPDGLVDILPTKTPSLKRTKDMQPDGLDILPTKPPSPKRTKDKVQLKLNQIDLSHASALDAAWAKCAPKRGPIKFVCWNNLEGTAGSGSMSTEQSTKHLKQAYSLEAKKVPHSDMSCIIEFDGASKGNPGKAGAGAILRNLDGSVICRLREGLGVATNNVAEYQALLLGMRFALKKGYKQIQVQGDSKIVCMQVEDRWKAKHENMACLCKEAKGLKDSFLSFSINHVKREFNADADAEANLAVDLPVGDITEEFS